MDLKKLWNAIRTVEASLPGKDGDPIYIISVENEVTNTTAGSISAAPRQYAARWIATGTHKLASPEQIEQYHAELKARTDAINRTELEKKQTVRLETAIPEDQLQRAVAAALADQGAKHSGKPSPRT
jgi:hypothetical protein